MAVAHRKTMLTLAAGAAATTLLGLAAAPAFAKSDSALAGPRTAQLRHAFHLTVTVGDDAGAKPARARLQIRDAHGHFRWYGGWQPLHRISYLDETATFGVTGLHRGPETFRAVVTGYAATNIVTITVRLPLSPATFLQQGPRDCTAGVQNGYIRSDNKYTTPD